MKQILINLLFVIAFGVFVILMINHAAPWWLIATYWLTLTVKNFTDIKGV